jgi:hypothetical protein
MGLRKMVNRSTCRNLHQSVRLEVDGKLVDMPAVEGIVILNILRFPALSFQLLYPDRDLFFLQLGVRGQSMGT